MLDKNIIKSSLDIKPLEEENRVTSKLNDKERRFSLRYFDSLLCFVLLPSRLVKTIPIIISVNTINLDHPSIRELRVDTVQDKYLIMSINY